MAVVAKLHLSDRVQHLGRLLYAAMKQRRKLKLNTPAGRERWVKDALKTTGLVGMKEEHFYRVKALCFMRGVENRW